MIKWIACFYIYFHVGQNWLINWHEGNTRYIYTKQLNNENKIIFKGDFFLVFSPIHAPGQQKQAYRREEDDLWTKQLKRLSDVFRERKTTEKSQNEADDQNI